MSLISEKQFLTEEELNNLKQIQNQTQSLIIELGEIEMIKIQIENRYNNAKNFLTEISNLEETFTKSILDKYGKINIDPKTGEITKLD